MSNNTHDDTGRDPWVAPPGKLSQRLREGALLTVLGFLLIIVQAPLAWMIVTSFKVKGTAFRLDFIPSSWVVTPHEGTDAMTIAKVSAKEHLWHVEYRDPTATTVQVAWGAGSAEEFTRVAMQPSIDGVWFADLLMQPGEYNYAFSVNGTTPTASEQVVKISNENAREILGVNVVSTPKDARSLIFESGGQTYAHIVPTDDTEGVELRLDRAKKMLGASGKVFELASGPAAKTVRIAEKRPFKEALGALYTLDNFDRILNSEDFKFGRYALNSFLVAFGAGAITVIICTLAGYAFAVKVFHFRDRIFYLLFASMLIPGMIFMVPQYSITIEFGWLNTLQGMIVPHLANVFGLFLMRQYIGQIPGDLFAAAKIDGANEVQVFQNVVIPLCLPIMVTLFLLTFVSQWSNFLWQLIINTGDSPWITLPVGLQRFKGQFGQDWEKIMAGACFSILPIAALFIATQRYFMQGLTAGAVKE